MTSERNASTIDVAIVGGGVAGCYSAYRLASCDRNTSPVLRGLLEASGRDRLTIELYETSDRIGGRLFSHRFPECPDAVAEFGGMCFSPLHANVYGLCTRELGLPTEQGFEFQTWNLNYLRSHRFAFEEFSPPVRTEGHYPETVPYFLPEQERWKFPLDVMIEAFDRAVPGTKDYLDRLKALDADKIPEMLRVIGELDQFVRDAELAGGQPLYDAGFWNILSEHSSHEAYQMATMSTGWYSATANWCAYNTMLGCFIDFAVKQDWTKLADGYESLPREMADRFADHGTIRTGTSLEGLSLDEEDDEPVIVMRLRSSDSGETWTQRARHVILALPQRALWLLDEDTFLFQDQQFVRDLSTVTCEPASKLFLVFDEPWWNRVSIPSGQGATIQNGLSCTDLPIRVCYYVDSHPDGRSLLLASANDSIATEFWDGFLPSSRYGLANHPVRGGGPPTPLLHEAPAAMVASAVAQLEEMHGCTVPAPLASAYVNWSQDPYGGGLHFWNTHERSWEVMPRIRRPVRDVNVFVCGEAFSAKQGWVEGAINTAEMTLETYFGMPRPTWVEPDYYELGP